MNPKSLLEKICDLVAFGFTFMFLVTIFFGIICDGVSGANMSASCPISQLDELATVVIGIFYLSSFVGFLWIWFPIIGFVYKVRRVQEIGYKFFLKNYKFDAIIYLPVLLLILGISFSVVMSIVLILFISI